MNELEKKTQNLSQNQKTGTNLTLKERLNSKKAISLGNACLILDFSHSMNIDIEPGKSRVQTMKEIVKSLKRNFTMIRFEEVARVIDDLDNEVANGFNTRISTGMELAISDGFREAIILTDGVNAGYDNARALSFAKQIKLRIMYIGPGERPAFLYELAKASGSFCTVEDLTKPKQISEKMQLLLTGCSLCKGSGEVLDPYGESLIPCSCQTSNKKGPICL